MKTDFGVNLFEIKKILVYFKRTQVMPTLWQIFITTLFFISVISLINAMEEDLDFYLEEVRSLSELPLDKLIHIKSTFADEINELEDGNLTVSNRMSPISLPSALPLKRNNKNPIRRYEEWEEKGGKDSKISKIFQLAITALSFLAFGGYLLTLIIMAVKRTAAPTTASVIVLSDLKNLQKIKRPKRNIFIFDPIENDFDTDRVYRGMLMLSRGYALYNK